MQDRDSAQQVVHLESALRSLWWDILHTQATSQQLQDPTSAATLLGKQVRNLKSITEQQEMEIERLKVGGAV